MRAASELERHPELGQAAFATFRDVCEQFFARELGAAASFLSAWLACDRSGDGRALGSAMLTVVPTLPRPGIPEPFLDARVRNVYVEPAARRRGIARALMLEVMREATLRGVRRLTLGASAMGRPLYLRLGFVPKADEMVIDLGNRPRETD
jgi:GNAT superfamily N-acetyltransferase